MKSVQRLQVNEKEILILDYSSCKEAEMMALATEFMQLALAENKMVLVMTVYNEKGFVTPKVMAHFEKVTSQILHLVDKAALVGLSPTKKIILKGYNLLFNRNYRAFNTRQEAIAYLIDPNSK